MRSWQSRRLVLALTRSHKELGRAIRRSNFREWLDLSLKGNDLLEQRPKGKIMDELSTLQSRVDALLAMPIAQPPARGGAAIAPRVATEGVVATPGQSFSPFDTVQMLRASGLAARFMALANSKEGTAGLSAAL